MSGFNFSDGLASLFSGGAAKQQAFDRRSREIVSADEKRANIKKSLAEALLTNQKTGAYQDARGGDVNGLALSGAKYINTIQGGTNINHYTGAMTATPSSQSEIEKQRNHDFTVTEALNGSANALDILKASPRFIQNAAGQTLNRRSGAVDASTPLTQAFMAQKQSAQAAKPTSIAEALSLNQTLGDEDALSALFASSLNGESLPNEVMPFIQTTMQQLMSQGLSQGEALNQALQLARGGIQFDERVFNDTASFAPPAMPQAMPSPAPTPATVPQGWQLMTDAAGNQAYVSASGEVVEIQ